MEELCPDLARWYRDHFSEGILPGSAGCDLRYAFQDRDAGTGVLLIVAGRTEFLEKYLELARDLQQTGMTICLYDHCGQGRSGRLLADSQKGHIDDFATYVADLEGVVAAIDDRYGVPPLSLLTHSMGGTVGALYALRHPQRLQALILVSPMFQINTGWLLPPLFVETVSSLLSLAGAGGCYVFGGGPFDPGQAFAGNCLTSDERRFALNLGLMSRLPGVALGSPTFGWLRAAYRAMRRVRGRAARIVCPTLLLEAAEERVVGSREMERFCAAAPDCRHRVYPRGHHELLMENDELRARVLDEIGLFLAARGATRSRQAPVPAGSEAGGPVDKNA